MQLLEVRSIREDNYGAVSLIEPKQFDAKIMVKAEDFKEKKAPQSPKSKK